MKITLWPQYQRGDTLIEVVIATLIIGVILFSAYTLSSKAFQLGQSAKERTQAAQILQDQAEGLRSLRDNQTNNANWSNFQNNFLAFAGATDQSNFHVIKTNASPSTWQFVNGGFSPGGTNVAIGQDPDIATFYTVSICGTFSGSYSCPAAGSTTLSCPSIANDTLCVAITVSWPRLGNGPTETSTLYYHLTDRAIPVKSGMIDAQQTVGLVALPAREFGT